MPLPSAGRISPPACRILLKGDWAKAHALVEHWITTLRTGNVAIHLPWAFAASAWALAQLGETDEALERAEEAEALA